MYLFLSTQKKKVIMHSILQVSFTTEELVNFSHTAHAPRLIYGKSRCPSDKFHFMLVSISICGVCDTNLSLHPNR